jgi:hypothetical protein
VEIGEEGGHVEVEVAQDGQGADDGGSAMDGRCFTGAVGGDGFGFRIDEPEKAGADAHVEVCAFEDAASVFARGDDFDCEIRIDRHWPGGERSGEAARQGDVDVGEIDAFLLTGEVANFVYDDAFAGFFEIVS